jgi:hypothetical protein
VRRLTCQHVSRHRFDSTRETDAFECRKNTEVFESIDRGLELLSKLGSILVPLVIAVIGWTYTAKKDRNDALARAQQAQVNSEQKQFNATQKQYANLTALLPLLTSNDPEKVNVGLKIYTSEAAAGQAPTALQLCLRDLANQFPDKAALVQKAVEAGFKQQSEECSDIPGGIYVQVANSDQQVALGNLLGNSLTQSGVNQAIQGIQRIEKGPNTTQLRYYFNPSNDIEAHRIVAALASLGAGPVQLVDLTAAYLKKNCQPPSVFELWIGESTPLKPS